MVYISASDYQRDSSVNLSKNSNTQLPGNVTAVAHEISPSCLKNGHKCEHACIRSSSGHVRCTCNEGFELQKDGYRCLGMECTTCCLNGIEFLSVRPYHDKGLSFLVPLADWVTCLVQNFRPLFVTFTKVSYKPHCDARSDWLEARDHPTYVEARS